MSNAGDPFEHGSFHRVHASAEQWLGSADPVESFGNTVEQALHRLTVELAGLRAERDGLRLEIEGIRTQLELTQQQLADRDRFASTVRELSLIVGQLTLPPRWTPDPAPPTYAPPPQPVSYAPLTWAPQVAPPQVPPSAPDFVAPTVLPPQPFVTPPPFVATEPVVTTEPALAPEPLAAPQPVAPQAVVSTAPVEAPAADAAELIAPSASPSAAPVGPEVVAPVAPVDPDPAVRVEPADPVSTAEVTAEPTEAHRRVEVGLETRRESFFDQPGTWFEEPERAGNRLDTAKRWGSWIASGFGVVIVGIVLLVSIGPKFLPYQTYFVRSGSMSPTFDTGDLIVLSKADAATLDKGDIITFERPDRPGTLITHRIHTVESTDTGKVFVTKGDANNDVDSWKVPAAGDGWKYNFRTPKLGFVFGYLGTQQARLALLIIPAVILGALSLIDIWKPQPKAKAKAAGKH